MNEEKRIENEEEEQQVQNEAEKEKGKCFIIQDDPFYFSATTEGMQRNATALKPVKDVINNGNLWLPNSHLPLENKEDLKRKMTLSHSSEHVINEPWW